MNTINIPERVGMQLIYGIGGHSIEWTHLHRYICILHIGDLHSLLGHLSLVLVVSGLVELHCICVSLIEPCD